MRVGFHVKNLLFLSYFNETLVFTVDFGKMTNIKFKENPVIRSRVVPCRQAAEVQTDIRKLIVAFGNFANAPKNKRLLPLNVYRLISRTELDAFTWI
jgi:hypothetical protein